MKKFFKFLLTGILYGFTSGFFSFGGGIILIPLLKKIFSLSEKDSRTNTIFCLFPVVLASFIFNFSKENFNLTITLNCIIGSIIGSFIGFKLLNKLQPKYLNLIFSFFLFFSGFKYIFFN